MALPVKQIGFYARAASKAGFWAPLAVGTTSMLIGLPQAVNDARNQKPGDGLPTLAGDLGGLAFATTGRMTLASLGPVGTGLAVASFFAPNPVSAVLSRSLRVLSDVGRKVGRLEMGGSYVDSISAKAARDAAIQQMNGTMVASRRWLGQEALILHS